jgi:hypothetical protein
MGSTVLRLTLVLHCWRCSSCAVGGCCCDEQILNLTYGSGQKNRPFFRLLAPMSAEREQEHY